MQTKEKKICSFTQKGTRLQLIKTSKFEYDPESPVFRDNPELNKIIIIYQVRLNRKIVSSSISEYNERKVFATYAQNIVLQLKIY